ncbi:MAG TPA: hypothetical protein VFA99_10515 [Acidobacteriaceae bacterium]|nr:hypothetical protein [Acidobacteriaceae bacterium]
MSDYPLRGGEHGDAAVSLDDPIGDARVHKQRASFNPMGDGMVSFAGGHLGQSRYAERVCHLEGTGR